MTMWTSFGRSTSPQPEADSETYYMGRGHGASPSSQGPCDLLAGLNRQHHQSTAAAWWEAELSVRIRADQYFQPDTRSSWLLSSVASGSGDSRAPVSRQSGPFYMTRAINKYIILIMALMKPSQLFKTSSAYEASF
ncbi:hypothetical protein CEXT_142491 [Caerostris extrusa]|uniref:Uncharacterized protein n=1 Tax=Caerostris extrusa TaxID=172846 RepID=A0AAV4ULZ8_CAEEX|nr:hypothetical protein CEXT_142491 [Caerostris extrusa]